MALAVFAALVHAPIASAMSESGNPCIGDASEPSSTLIGFANQSPTTPFLPAQVLEEDGVITRWKVQVAPGNGPLAQQLVLVQQTGEESARKVVESGLETVVEGNNEFAARIPVPQFSLLGLDGPAATLFCSEEALHTAGVVKDPYAIGESRHYEVQVNFGVPAVAVIEPDRDGDGYGDETQDGCPAVTALQTACPTVALTRRKATVGKRAILIQVRVSSEAEVKVFGQVSWQVRQKGGGNRGLTAGLSAGRARSVAAGTTATFRLPLTKPVKRRLERLEPDESLRAQLTAQVTDFGGRVTERRFRVKLKGRG
jgi:hypothetical protein